MYQCMNKPIEDSNIPNSQAIKLIIILHLSIGVWEIGLVSVINMAAAE